MDLVTGKFDINLVEHKPFVHKDPAFKDLWPKILDSLRDNFPNKRLYCASDSYITETPMSINLSNILQADNSFISQEVYVSHVFHRNGHSIDPELDFILPTPECLGIDAVGQFRIKRLVAGASGTGTALHQHSRAYFHNIMGTKKWFLAPPTKQNQVILSEFAYDVKNKKIDSISEWFALELPRLCKRMSGYSLVELEPGHSLYIPDGYYHAVLNMSFTVGIAYSWERRFQIGP